MSSAALARTHEPVAIVDDDPGALQALRFLLQVEGFEVSAFGGGRAFLEAVQRHGSSCLVIDQNMPGMTGLEVIESLRRNGMHIPAIMMTASPDSELDGRARAAGVEHVIEKPVFGDLLAHAIRQCLSQDPGRPG
jgi:two-component system, LuxR family, response regulator FixJ